MSKFTFDDIVQIVNAKVLPARQGERAWVVGVAADRKRFPLTQFPIGTVYTLEFEDGSSCDVHEDDLELFDLSDRPDNALQGH